MSKKKQIYSEYWMQSGIENWFILPVFVMYQKKKKKTKPTTKHP